jgi:hypothetical protein
MEGWRKLNNVVFHNLCSLPGIIRMKENEMVRLYSMTGAEEECIFDFGLKLFP